MNRGSESVFHYDPVERDQGSRFECKNINSGGDRSMVKWNSLVLKI